MKALSDFQKSVAASALLRTVQSIERELRERKVPGGYVTPEYCAKSDNALKHERETLLTVIIALQEYK